MLILIITILLIGVSLLGLYMLYVWFSYIRLKREVLEMIACYRPKLTGNNRFVLNYEMLKEMFSEYDAYDVYKVFCQLVEEGHIKRDPLDGEYCIA